MKVNINNWNLSQWHLLTIKLINMPQAMSKIKRTEQGWEKFSTLLNRPICFVRWSTQVFCK